MDGAYDVPDSTDWLNTPLQGFAELEGALHCQICKEFYDTPMITSCNHTFCSKCIRTSLSADGKCPACRASDQASKLRNNWAIQEVVSTFLAARPSAMDVARKAQEEVEAPKRVGKRKRTAVPDDDDIVEAEPSGRTTRSKSRRIAASQGSQPEPIEIEDSEDDAEEYKPEPEPDDGLVECPLGCGKRMKEEQVFGHLDKCEDEKKQASRAKSRTPLNGFGSSRPASSQSTRPQDRINELNYGMMKETALSKKFKEIGIPNWGGKQLMIQRHREWVNIWNANCDSTKPRTKRELLHDLDVWERTQGGRAPNVNGLSSTIMKKDFDGDAYSRRHQDEFSRLIADARRKKNNPATESKSPKDGETAGSPEVDEAGEKSSFFADSNQQQQNGESHQPNGDQTDPQRPYENNQEALSYIREKVEALNQGQEVKSTYNEGFRNPATEVVPQEPRLSQPSENMAINAHDLVSTQQRPASKSSSTNVPTLPEHSPDSSEARVRRPSSKDEHAIHENTGSPCDLATHLQVESPDPPKKVPMFDVPQHSVGDIDGSMAGP